MADASHVATTDVCDAVFPVYDAAGRACALVLMAVPDHTPQGPLNTVVLLAQVSAGWELWTGDSIAGRQLQWAPRAAAAAAAAAAAPDARNTLEPLEILVQRWSACLAAERSGSGGQELPRVQYASLPAPYVHPTAAQMETLFDTHACPFNDEAAVSAMRAWLDSTPAHMVLSADPMSAIPHNAFSHLAAETVAGSSSCMDCSCPSFNPCDTFCNNMHTMCSQHLEAYMRDVHRLLRREPSRPAALVCPRCQAPLAVDTLLSAVFAAHAGTLTTHVIQENLDLALQIVMHMLSITSFGQLTPALAV